MEKRLLTRLLYLISWCACCFTAQATLLVSENFGYPAGELNGQSGGTGFAGGWTANTAVSEVVASGLSFTRADGFVHNGRAGALQLQGNADNAAVRSFSGVNGNQFYVGMLLNVAGSLQNNDFGAGWFNNMNGIGLGLKANQGNGSGTFDVFARVKLDGDSAAYYQNLTMGLTYLVVARFSKTVEDATKPFNMAELWVNPVYASSGSPNASIVQTLPGMSSSVSSLGFRSANLDTGDAVYYDMMRVGTTWADVVPVPESTTMIAGMLLLLPFGAHAWRKLQRRLTRSATQF